MADGMMGLDVSGSGGGWDPTLFGPQIFGDPGSGLIFSPQVNDPSFDPTTAASFPWLSNAPSGSVFSSDASTPTMDWLTSTPGGTDIMGSGGFNMPGFGTMWDGAKSVISGMVPSGVDPKSLIPGAMALTYAGMQPGIDTGPLNAVLGQLNGSTDAIVKAATDPIQANIAAGYGDLLQSQGLRGIRGSSFGDTDIANYLSTTGRSVGDAAASATAGSLSLQGNLAAQIAALKNQSQQIKNNLYGTAFDVLGRGLNPKGYTGSTNINVGGGGGVAAPSNNGFLGTGISTGDIGAAASIASLFSDRRLKDKIVKVAEDARGFGIYVYELFGEKTWGVMADEVEKVIPEAVKEVMGFKTVNYGLLFGGAHG